MIPFRRTALAGMASLATAFTLSAGGPAQAMSTTDPATEPAVEVAAAEPVMELAVEAADEASLPPRLERACLRIPNLQLRTERLMDRLDGDESTIGSLMWLTGKVDDARSAGREQLATVLENRLAVRTSTREILDLRVTELAELERRCTEFGVEL